MMEELSMKKTIHNVLLFSLAMLIGILGASCGTKSYINVNYRLPLSSYDLKGKKVFLEIKDMRSHQDVFSEKAKTKFKNFTGLFLLSLSENEKNDYVAGAFDLPSLFETAFSKRLENMGIEILTEQKETEPVIEIDLKKFILDLADRKWIAEISYEARLIKENGFSPERPSAPMQNDTNGVLRVMWKKFLEKSLQTWSITSILSNCFNRQIYRRKTF